MDKANNKDVNPGLQLRRMGGKRAEASPPLALDVESTAPSSNRLVTTPSSSSSSSSDNHFNGFRFHFPGFVKRHQRSNRRCNTGVGLDRCDDGNDDDDYASSSSSSSVIFSPGDRSSWRSSARLRSGHKAATRNSFPTMKRMKSLLKHHKAPLRSTKKLRLDCEEFSGEDEDSSIHPVLHKDSKPLTTSTERDTCSLPHTELASDICIIDDGLSAIIRQMFKENDHSHNNGTCEGNKCSAATGNAKSILDRKQFSDNQSSLTNGMRSRDVPNKERRGEAVFDGNRVFENVDRPGQSLQNEGGNYPRTEVAPCGVTENEIEGAFNCHCQFCKGRRKCKQTSRSPSDFVPSKLPSKKASRMECVVLREGQDDTNRDPRRSFVKAAYPSRQQEEECQRESWYNGHVRNNIPFSNHSRCHYISPKQRRSKRQNCSRNVFGFVETSSSSSEKDETDDDICVVRPTASASCSGSPTSRKLKVMKHRPLKRNLYNSTLPKENVWQHPSSSRLQDYQDDVEVVPETPVSQRRRRCNFRIESDSSSSESFEPNNIPKQKSSFDSSPVFGNHSKFEFHESPSNDSMNLNPQTSEMVTSSPPVDCQIQDTSPLNNACVMDEVKRSRQMELDEAYARALQAQLNSEGFQSGCNSNEMSTVNRNSDAIGRHLSSETDRPIKLRDNSSMKKLQEPHKSNDRLNAHRHCKSDFEMNGSRGNRRNPLGIDEMSFGMPPSSPSQTRSHRSSSCRSSNQPVGVESRERCPVGRQCGCIGCSSDADLFSMTERLDDDDDNNNTYFVLRPLLNERRRSGSRSQLGRRVSRSVHAPDLGNEPEILGVPSILGGTSQSQPSVARSWSNDVNGRGARRGLRMPGTFRSSSTDRTLTSSFNSRESPEGSRSNDEDAPSASRRLSFPLHLRLSDDINFDRDLNSSTALPSPGEFEAVNSVLQMEMDEAYARMLQAQFNAETQMPTLSEPASSVTDRSLSANQRVPQPRMRSANSISGNQPQGIRQSGRRTPTQQPLLNPARHRTNIGRLRYPVEEIGVERAQFPSGLEEPILAYPISPRRTRSQTRRMRSTSGILGHQDNFRNLFAPAAFGIESDESDLDYELQTLVSNDDDFDNMYLLLGPILSPSRRPGGRALIGRRNQRRGRSIDTGNDYEEMLELDDRLGHVSKGLTRGQMNRLPTHPFRKGIKNAESGGSNCHICMSDYEEGEMLRVLPCFHEFHMQCIDKWLWEKDTCPVCRLNVVAN